MNGCDLRTTGAVAVTASCARADVGLLGGCSCPGVTGLLDPTLLLGAGDGARSPAALSADAIRLAEPEGGRLSTEVERADALIAGRGPAREPDDGGAALAGYGGTALLGGMVDHGFPPGGGNVLCRAEPSVDAMPAERGRARCLGISLALEFSASGNLSELGGNLAMRCWPAFARGTFGPVAAVSELAVHGTED